jgi:hypothetical protein
MTRTEISYEEVRHEVRTITIVREEDMGDNPWPGEFEGFRPDTITVRLAPDADVTVRVTGPQLKQDGTPGRTHVNVHLVEGGWPAWVGELVVWARRRHNEKITDWDDPYEPVTGAPERPGVEAS